MRNIPKSRAVTDAEKIKAMTESTAANLPLMIEAYKQDAAMQKAKFDAYIAVGFTDEQAIRLCVRT